MARKPRPVNPDDGPVQAFAHELRCLRESKGGPTYRVLAKVAGFSATSLGDAAGGVRLPTLEVALAYAGACGGDQVWWRERWQQAARLTERQTQARSGTAAAVDEAPIVVTDQIVSEAPPDPSRANVSEPVPGPPLATRRRWPFRIGAIGSAVAIMATCAWSFSGSAGAAASPPDPSRCPAFAPAAGDFTGRTYDSGANIRAGASLDAPVLGLIPPGCQVVFTGYCLGDVVHDPTADAPDARWFILSDHDVVASAVVHGNPPASLSPTACAYDVPAPTAISFSVTAGHAGSGTILLQAAGRNAAIIGYAYFYRDSRAPNGLWHQVGFTDVSTGLGVTWQPSAPAGAGILVVAVACMGGQAPTGVAVAGVVRTGAAPSISPTSLTPAQLSAAEREACQYPDIGD